ncbi:efflux transporter outer membrane subunit [Sphingomonas sp. KC8]|uniref:efflux transporter outer membrane subunit n=1 Tax=Sphingomonas sp. KC8 TaxID=1030157 RepID=UPI0002489FDF|nr:TolC family protein [Sphingomonas sp. KC8]ARS27888.1 transporter [Sphingomonas sp. KC8]
MRNPAFLLLPLLTAACAAGPEYRPPASRVAASAGFVTAAPATDSTAPLPDRWWRIYDDPVLDRLIARAFAANTDLRVAAANLDRARAVLGESRAGRLPQTALSGGAAYGDGQSGQAGASSRQWTYTGGLAVSWEADLFGRVGRAIEAAQADAQAVAAVRDAVRVTVAAETARAYANACSFADAAAVARESLVIAEDGLKLVTAQEKAGSAGRLDVERAATAVANARAAIAPIDGERRVALFELAALIGETPSGVPAEALQCAAPPVPVALLPIGDGAQLLRRRPDLREAERRLAADTARIGVAMADLYPRISFGGSANYLRNDAVRGADAFSFAVGPLLSWSFPNIAVARARIRQAEAQGDAALATFDGKVLGALKEVEQALATYAAQDERNRALVQARGSADTAYRLANARYRAGSISYLDLLVTQRDWTDARAALAESTQRLGSARIDLFKALGGGWEMAADQ